MKALSFHQPRAEQVVRGDKTVDIRTWHVSYRGPLAIHAAATRRADRCRELGFEPEALAYGAIIGIVELVDIRPIDADAYAALQNAHQMDLPFPGEPCYAWFLEAPRRLPDPLPVRGRMRLFEVKELSLQEEGRGPASQPPSRPRAQPPAPGAPPYRTEPPPEPDPTRPFALYTVPGEGNGYRVALHQWVPTGRTPQPDDAERQAPGSLWSVEVGGDPLRAVTDHLLAALRANGYKATDLARAVGSETPFYLDEPSGLRLALILIAVKPLTRYDRIAAIGHAVQGMSAEEAYYWFSKCSAGADAARAQKALRVLLADE